MKNRRTLLLPCALIVKTWKSQCWSIWHWQWPSHLQCLGLYNRDANGIPVLRGYPEYWLGIWKYFCLILFWLFRGGAKQAGIRNLFIRSWMRRRWWWPKNKLHILGWFYDEYKIPVNSLIWKEKSSFIITWQLKICELFWFDENKFSAIFWTEQNFLLFIVTWNLMFDNKNICFSSSWQTAAVGIREWCKKNTSCSWNLSWKCTRPSLVHLYPSAGPLSKGKSGRKLGPTCFCSGDEEVATLRPGNILDLRWSKSGWRQLQVFENW